MKHLPKITLALIAAATLYACNKKDDLEAMTIQHRNGSDTLHTRDSIDPWTGDTIVVTDPGDTIIVVDPRDTVVTTNPPDTIWSGNPVDTINNGNPFDTIWSHNPHDSIRRHH